MFEIRLHGRGGQGTVTASEMLASMYFESGKFVQAFPAFGVERRGAPVIAYTRVDEEPVEIHYGIYQPDSLIVLDQTLIEVVDVSQGLKSGGTILINSEKQASDFTLFKNFSAVTIDVNTIALRHGLGTSASPIVNTAVLGAYAAVTGHIPQELVRKIIIESAPAKKEENAAAASEAYETIITNES